MLNCVNEPFHYTFVLHCIDSFTLRNKFFVDFALPIEENHQHDLHTRLLKPQFSQLWRGFSDQFSGLTFSGRIVGKKPADYFLFWKVKSHLKGRFFDLISDIQKAVTGTLTLRELMSYIYGAPILDVSRSHTTTQHSR